MVYNASVAEAIRDFDDKYHYLKMQSIWAFLGFISMLIFSRIPVSFLKNYPYHYFSLISS
jgi:cell division protein FtsW (lipid II flippase)